MKSLPQTPQSIGQVLDGGLRLYRASFTKILPIAVIASAIMLAPNIVSYYVVPNMLAAEQQSGSPVTTAFVVFGTVTIVAMAFNFFFYLTMLHRLGVIAGGGEAGIGESMRRALRRLFTAIFATVLYALVVSVGFALLVVPGLIVMVSAFMFLVGIALDDDGALASLRHSHQLVWGNWWRSTTVLTVIFIIYLVVYMAVGAAGGFVDASLTSATFGEGVASWFGNFVATVITYTMMPSVLVVLYHDLKLRKGGIDLEARIQQAAAA